MTQRKQTRPSTKPIPIRFTEQMQKDIEEVAKKMDLSKQDIIRLSVSAGLKALDKLGYQGLSEKIAEEIE